jgi:hypothetical protein
MQPGPSPDCVSSRHTTQRVLILPKKKHALTGKQATAAGQSALPPGADDGGELKDFVDNYLALADQALGFMRRPGPQPELTVSTCLYCQHTLAASNLKLLAFAESLHVCPVKRSPNSHE